MACGLAEAPAAAGTTPCPPIAAGPHDAAYRSLRVDAAGGAELTGVQQAVDSVVASACPARVEIVIAPGRYRERLTIPPAAPPLTLRGLGASPGDVVLMAEALSSGESLAAHALTRAAGDELDPGQPAAGAATVRVDSGDHIFSNLTIANTRVRLPGDVGFRTLAARVAGDRVVFTNVHFANWGSDLLGAMSGRQYYHRCRFDARDKGTDFIFGSARAVFEGCRIRIASSRTQLVAHGRGHGPEPWADGYAGGFVFSRCRVETGPGVEVFLGRSWRGGGRIVFLRSWLGAGVRPEGWSRKELAGRESSVFFAEHASRGPGARPNRRVPWARRLDAGGARPFSTRRFLRDASGAADAWLEYLLRLDR